MSDDERLLVRFKDHLRVILGAMGVCSGPSATDEWVVRQFLATVEQAPEGAPARFKHLSDCATPYVAYLQERSKYWAGYGQTVPQAFAEAFRRKLCTSG